jgi:hypothetical protein
MLEDYHRQSADGVTYFQVLPGNALERPNNIKDWSQRPTNYVWSPPTQFWIHQFAMYWVT